MLPTKTGSYRLPESVFTVCHAVGERRLLLDELQKIDDFLYSVNEKDLSNFINESIRESTREIVLEILGGDVAFYHQRLKNARDALQHLPLVQVTLAVEPTPALLQRMWEQLHQHLPEPFLLSVAVDSWLLGGMRVTFQGKFRDYTLKERIEEIIKN